MLEYLVTSKVRRRLLGLLWGEGTHGSVSELADRAGVAFAGAHAELKAMLRAQLVVTRHDGNKESYSANLDHPEAEVLRALVNSKAVPAPPSEADKTVKRQLAALGAPLRGVEPLAEAPSEWMRTLVNGASLARRDAVVARTLPLVFWNLRESLDLKALLELAARPDDKHAVGFFLELSGELGGDRRLVGLAEGLRDRRMKSTREFFQSPTRHGPERDFPLAAKWGFRMNMDLESFKTLFDKFVDR